MQLNMYIVFIGINLAEFPGKKNISPTQGKGYFVVEQLFGTQAFIAVTNFA